MACTVIHGGSPLSTGLPFTPTNRADALKILDDRLREGMPTGIVCNTVSDLFRCFQDMNPSITRRRFEYLRRYFRILFASQNPSLTNPLETKLLVAKLLANKEYSPNYKRQLLKGVRQVFAWGVDEGLTQGNPISKSLIPAEQVEDPLVPTYSDVMMILSNAYRHHRGYYQLLALSAMRPFEALALKWSDIADGTITVHGKRKQERTPRKRIVVIDLIPGLAECLATIPRDGERLFPQTTSTPAADGLRHLCKTLNLPTYSLKHFRKYALEWWTKDLRFHRDVITAMAGNDDSVRKKYYVSDYSADELRRLSKPSSLHHAYTLE
jgi:integrase